MTMLGVLAQELSAIGIPYAFVRWTTRLQYPYFVGEYTETPVTDEDGGKESTVLLTGTTNGDWIDLERARAKIERHFPAIYGLRRPVDDGVVVFYYSNSLPVPTGEAELKRIQINLQIKEWRTMQ
jgi:hypothetical protein